MTFAAIIFFFKKYWRLLALAAGIVVFVILIALVFRSCNKPPKLDEKQIQEAITAIEQKNDRKLKEILAESDTEVERIDSNIKLAEEATRQAEKKYDGWSTDQLAAEIERRKNQ